jgi:hypothetical protein
MAEEKAEKIGYPKMLYLEGDRTKKNAVVKDAEEETAKRAEGYRMMDQKIDAQAKTELAELEKAKAQNEDAEEPAPKGGGKGRK